MSSPTLAAPHVAAAQSQKEVTINDATDALDLAVTASAQVDCAAGGTVDLPVAVVRRAVRLVLTGAPGAAFTLRLPAVARPLIVANATDTTATLANATGWGVEIAPDAQQWVYATGDGVHAVGAGRGGGVYDFGMLADASPAGGAVMGKVVLPRAVVLPADLAGARAHVDTPPETPFEIALRRDADTVATLTVAPDGSVACATAAGAPGASAPGQVVRFVAPAVADPAIAGIAVTLAGALA